MNRIAKMIVVLTVIGLISGGVLALVYQWAAPRIEINQIKATDAAIFKVLPESKSYQKVAASDLVYYECFGRDGARVGTAIECNGNGYQGVINMLVGVNADFSKFTGMVVLQQVETPGLGARIAAPGFADQFKGLSARPPIEYVKNQKPEKANQIEALTGATISSRSVVNIINKTVEQWLKAKE